MVAGRGAFVDGHTISVDGHRYRAPRIVIATGSRPALPPVEGLADSSPLTSESLFDLSRQPAHLVVLGGSPIGCEMAQAFTLLGTKVTVVEREERLLPLRGPSTHPP